MSLDRVRYDNFVMQHYGMHVLAHVFGFSQSGHPVILQSMPHIRLTVTL